MPTTIQKSIDVGIETIAIVSNSLHLGILQITLTEAKTPAVWPHLKDLRATREGRLFAVDGHHLFNRPGPRLVDSLEVLAEIIHPESFHFEATARFAKRIKT